MFWALLLIVPLREMPEDYSHAWTVLRERGRQISKSVGKWGILKPTFILVWLYLPFLLLFILNICNITKTAPSEVGGSSLSVCLWESTTTLLCVGDESGFHLKWKHIWKIQWIFLFLLLCFKKQKTFPLLLLWLKKNNCHRQMWTDLSVHRLTSDLELCQ